MLFSTECYTITFRKPYIASMEIWIIGLWTVGLLDCGTVGTLEIWTIGLRTVGPFDYNLIQMDDYLADSCVISPTAFSFDVLVVR